MTPMKRQESKGREVLEVLAIHRFTGENKEGRELNQRKDPGKSKLLKNQNS